MASSRGATGRSTTCRNRLFCSSDPARDVATRATTARQSCRRPIGVGEIVAEIEPRDAEQCLGIRQDKMDRPVQPFRARSAEHTPELQSQMRTSYAALCL